MPSVMGSTELVGRLAALRARVRRRLVAYGVFAVVGGGAVAFLTIVTLDWLLWLPPALRALGSFLFLAGAFGASYYWIIKPLRAQLGIEEIAGRLERHFVPLRDRLSSSVNFLRGAPGASPELVREVIADTEKLARGLPLESAISIEPVAVRGSICGVSMVVLLLLLGLMPRWVRTGVERYASPFGPAEWPRRVLIVPLTTDLAVPVGESATVSMRIDRGWRDSLRGVVHLESQRGSLQSLTMRSDERGTFYAGLDAVTEDLSYWFEAGDDDTERRPGRISVIQRPEVIEALATIAPPEYASDRPARTEDLAQSAIHATVGSRLSVQIRASKPVSQTASMIEIQPEDEKHAILELLPAASPELLMATLTVRRDTALNVQLRDEHGFANRGQALYRIVARPDAVPSVTILQPTSILEVTPKAVIALQVRAEDDFGIAGIDLQASVSSNGTPTVISLSEHALLGPAEEGVSLLADYAWSLDSLRVSPGDLVAYEAVAVDTYATGGVQGQSGRSGPQQIRIISEPEFELRVREDIAALEARIRQAVLEQEEVRDRTDALARSMQPSGLTDIERNVAASLSNAQGRLGRSIRDVSSRFDQLEERVAQNQPTDLEGRERIRAIADALRRTAAETMASAESSLLAAREQAEPGPQSEYLAEAVSRQSAASDELRALLRSVSQWGTFQGLVSKTRDLLDRQLRVQVETSEIGQSALGKSAEALSPAEAEALARAQRQQEQLAADVDQHLARMREQSESSRARQPGASDAIDSAIRAARANQLDKKLQAAAEAIGENRTAAANIEQRAAADAMRQMVSALRERERRELEELRKKLTNAQEQVTWLIEHQKSVLSATNEAGLVRAEAETFSRLEQEQRTLTRNTILTGGELSALDDAEAAGRLVREAGGPMERSTLGLAEQLADSAAFSQQEAIDLLQRALALLEEASRLAAENASRQSLDHIQDTLQQILTAQLDINAAVAKLEGSVRGRQSLSRAEARQAATLARDQDEARGMIAKTLEDLQRVPVYEWALQRTEKWMAESRDSLENRRITPELMDTTERIAQELRNLIGAIVETLRMPLGEDFAEAEEAGGGSGGGSAGGPPVPSIAELLVLKTMQIDVNRRTQQLAGELGDNAGEAGLRRLAVIAEDQAEIRRLTEMVIQRAAQPE